tara:strand:+ start:153 stop:3164 length:3012 start_codon:yes stop_codon:yes gene_type:complete
MTKKNKGNAVMINEYYDTLKTYINKYGDKTILFWQCGDFYEVYGRESEPENLLNFTRICDFTYSSENGNLKAGMPKRAVQKWSNRIIENGYTLVIFDQFKDPTVKSHYRKESYILSPSTTIETCSNTINNNYCSVIWIEKYNPDFQNKLPYFYCGVSVIDSFTGKSIFYEYKYENNDIHNTTAFDKLDKFVSIYNPTECVIIHNYDEISYINDIIQFASINAKKNHIISLKDLDNELTIQAKNSEKQTYQKEILNHFFDIKDYNVFLETTRFNYYPYATSSYCFLLDFMYQHNPNLINKISYPIFENNKNNIDLATHCLKQLNIIDTVDSNKEYSSVLKLINKCKTIMGKRRFNHIILHPSCDINYLKTEYNIIEYVIKEYTNLEFIRKELSYIKDIEKLYRKINLGVVKPHELANLSLDLERILTIKKTIDKKNKYKKYLNSKINQDIEDNLNHLNDNLKHTLNIENCIKYAYNNKECTNIFNKNIYPNIDKYYKKYIEDKQKLLLIKHFLIEISLKEDKTSKHINSDNYIRIHSTEKSGVNLEITSRRSKFLQVAIQKIIKQSGKTYVSLSGESNYDDSQIKIKFDIGGLKFTGKSSSSSTNKISGSSLNPIYKEMLVNTNMFNELIKSYFTDYVSSLIPFNNELNNIVEYISLIDITLNKAFISIKNNYNKPKINSKPSKSFFNAENLRHPLIEHIQQDEIYVPNDISLGKDKNGILLYGTNAVGKSSLIKSIGINVILAQSGMYVAASKFVFKPYTSIFTRILGNDNIFKGLSTFAVEMCELRTILNNCNENSLILGDELCSGTEIISALSIFTTGVHFFQKNKSSYIFATHFHELTSNNIIMELQKKKQLEINHMAVEYDRLNDRLVWTRKLEKGSGNKMYGLEVCKALNMPEGFVDFALNVRNKSSGKTSILSKKTSNYNSKQIKGLPCELCGEKSKDIHHLNPQKYANKDGFIGTHHKNHLANIIPICGKCHENVTKNEIIHKTVKTSDGIILVEQ